MSTLFVIWQDPKARSWHVVGKLGQAGSCYTFQYTRGALQAKDFRPFQGMEDLHSKYESQGLFPTFSNRIISKSRPEYKKLLEWLDLDSENTDVLNMLSLTSGERTTDNIRLISPPERSDNELYKIKFFIHGLRYIPEDAQEYTNKLDVGQELFMMLDVQNRYDPDAVAIRSALPTHFLGYLPLYYSADVKELLCSNRAERTFLRVSRVNVDAPLQYRVLCELSTPWSNGFIPQRSEEYQSILTNNDEIVAL